MRHIKSHITAYWRGVKQIDRYIPRLFTAITLHSLTTVAAWYLTVWLGARLLEELCTAHDRTSLITQGIILLGLQAVLSLIGGAFKRMKEAKWERLYRSVDCMIDDKLLSLDHATLSDANTRSHAARIREHTHSLGRGLVEIPEIFQHLTNGVFGVVGALVMCALSEYRLIALVSLALLGMMTLCASVLFTSARHAHDTATDKVLSLDRAYYALYDMMFDADRASDIRLYRQDRLINTRLRRTDRVFFKKGGLKHQPLRELFHTLVDEIPLVWAGAVWMLIAVQAGNGFLSLNSAVCYLGVSALLTRHAVSVRDGLEHAARNMAYIHTALAFLDIPPKMYCGSLTTEKRNDRDYTLSFDRVSFRYPSQSTPGLKQVSARLSPGKRIAVVGENGSGKSTFVKLLCRLYDPDDGTVLLNGIDIRKYRSEEYTDLVSVVFQDFRLFACPLEQNVSGTSVCDRERVVRCLSAVGYPLPHDAGVDEVLSATLHPDTMSSADCQKIAIARALYKNAPFIILDEPTASLDPVAEAEIYAHLDRIVEDRTAVFISHRLSSCRFCDEILVFDDGAVVQRGTHRELLADPKGKYYALWHAQAQYYQ